MNPAAGAKGGTAGGSVFREIAKIAGAEPARSSEDATCPGARRGATSVQ
ncbi:hypothetical protein FTUN_6553 [Frigoriglobus tundricola]|uniref:Uncharacterized protein n=1 Tax=Frigoriglobus tundricola TaxID=2774151 RepID=A0A6M5YYM5_9BACT|nr:hypothetical protein FTUN_6553 [Frigoriglobus tundricola]